MVLGDLCGSSGNREELCPCVTPKVFVKNGELQVHGNADGLS